jgi:hypothetical protein
VFVPPILWTGPDRRPEGRLFADRDRPDSVRPVVGHPSRPELRELRTVHRGDDPAVTPPERGDSPVSTKPRPLDTELFGRDTNVEYSEGWIGDAVVAFG